MNEVDQKLQKILKDLRNLVDRKIPVATGKFAKDHFQDNFRKGGFVNNGLQPWPPAKRLSSGDTSAAAQHGTLLSSRNHLFSSIKYRPGTAQVTIFNDVIYAEIHNEGGTVHPRITPKMRRYAWAKYYALGGDGKGPQKGRNGAKKVSSATGSAEAEKWKALALTKKESLTIKIPKREFMGPSEELNARIRTYVEEEVLKILNQ
ncbi:MAG: phage virion morphogenesis protein [Bacteroidales bacterium]|nr:phage virion morphogenesis protein [Bacteroidales bacterium]